MSAAVAEQSATETEVDKLERQIEAEEQEADYQRQNGQDDKGAAHFEEAQRKRKRLDDLKAEAGESTGEMQNEREPESALPPEEIIVAGLEQGYASLGGKKPTGGSLAFKGGKVKLAEGTSYKKGTVVVFSGTAVINDVGQHDTHDPQTDQIVSSEQRHEARITDLHVKLAGQ